MLQTMATTMSKEDGNDGSTSHGKRSHDGDSGGFGGDCGGHKF